MIQDSAYVFRQLNLVPTFRLSCSYFAILKLICTWMIFHKVFFPSMFKNLELRGKKNCNPSQNRYFLNQLVHGKVKEKTTRPQTR